MPARVYLQPKDLRHSRHHLAYASTGSVQPGVRTPTIHTLEFFNGLARDVPENIYQVFKDLGIADVTRPSFEEDSD